MRPLLESDFSEFKWMPFALGAFALLALRAIAFGKMSKLVDLVVLFLYFALFSFWKLWPSAVPIRPCSGPDSGHQGDALYTAAVRDAAASISGSARAEVFTSRTRASRASRGRSPIGDIQTALRRAAAAAPDWQGGTRIGEAVKTFLDSYGRRGMARGAVVVADVLDGWERDHPGCSESRWPRRRLAYRIVLGGTLERRPSL